MFFIVLISTLLTLDVLWWWWADRRLCPLRKAKFWRALVGAFMVVQITGYVWMMFGRFTGIEWDMPLWWLVVVYLWHLLVLPATAMLLIAMGMGWGLVSGARRLIAGPADCGDDPPDCEVDPPSQPELGTLALSRRQVIFAAAAVLPPLAAGGTMAESYHQRNQLALRRLTVPIPGLPAALDGCTIAHVSDIHAGTFTAGRKLAEITEVTNGLKADLVMVTGDFIDFNLRQMSNVKEMLKRLDRPDRTFMCEGNHDLFQDRDEFEGQMAEFQRSYGVPLLVNESRRLAVNGQAVQVLGLRWGYKRPHEGAMIDANMDELVRQRQADAFPILLAHHPHAFDNAAEAGIPLTLSGHTHGGQLMLTKQFGAGSLMFKYWSGLYRKREGRSALVVSNGAGNWFPLRINAPAEIVHITLRRASV